MSTPNAPQARVSPKGFVAQRFDIHSDGRWVLTYFDEHSGVCLKVLSDEDVAGWPELVAREG